jgi:hypothetical protein
MHAVNLFPLARNRSLYVLESIVMSDLVLQRGAE